MSITTQEELFQSASSTRTVFHPGMLDKYPAPVRRYLIHAIAPGTPLATAVRLRMHGEIKLKTWLPFTAQEVIHWKRGMIWSAWIKFHGLTVSGADSLLDGEGEMRWKLLGLIPLNNSSGPDITRSATGRMLGESVWLPSVYLQPEIWTVEDDSHIHARLKMQGVETRLHLTIDKAGRVREICFPRWGSIDGHAFHEENFGGTIDQEASFQGYTIPSKMKLGWYFGTDRYATEGEFFRGELAQVEYR